MADTIDPVIERLEADLLKSRFEPWEAETVIANIHRAKLPKQETPQFTWRDFRDITDPFFLYIGWSCALATLCLWMLGALD